MKRLSSIANGILGIVALLAMMLLLILAMNSVPPKTGTGLVVTSSLSYPAPNQISRSIPYPGPGATSDLVKPTIFPTATMAPKPTNVFGATPTVISNYQTLSLPPASFLAIWIENLWEDKGGILWVADPGDLNNKREIFSTKVGRITSAVVSMDGKKLAVATSESAQSVLWIVNFDGTEPKQVDQVGGIEGLVWSSDSLSLVYVARRQNSDPTKDNGREIILQNLYDGEKKTLVKTEANSPLAILGWSNAKDQIFYSLAEPKDVGYEMQLWSVDSNGQKQQRIRSLPLGNRDIYPILSPDGEKFLLVASTGTSLYNLSKGESRELSGTGQKQGYQIIWGNNDNEVIVSYFDPKLPVVYIELHNLEDGMIKQIGHFVQSPNGYDLRLLSISPDFTWLTVSESTGEYFVYIPSGEKAFLPYSDRQDIFVDWVLKTDK